MKVSANGSNLCVEILCKDEIMSIKKSLLGDLGDPEESLDRVGEEQSGWWVRSRGGGG